MTIGILFTVVLVLGVAAWLWIAGRKREAAWRQFANEIGAEFIRGGWFHSSKVQTRLRDWVVTVDTYTVPSGDSSTTYTRIRAPFQDEAGFQFSISRAGLIGKLDKVLGAQDIDTGVADFDRDFVIRGNSESKVKSLFADPGLRQRMQAQRSVHLRLTGKALSLEVQGIIRDVERLKSLFELFKDVLYQLAN